MAPTALGLVLAAVPFASWLLVLVVFVSGPTGPPLLVGELYRWLPSLMVGAALGWCGVVPWRRLGVWVVGLLAMFVTPAVFTASSYALGMRVLDGDLREMAGAAVQIFPRALVPGVAPTVLALVIAAAVTVVRWAIAHTRTETPAGGRAEA